MVSPATRAPIRRRIKPDHDRGPLEIIEEAVHLLRRAPAGLLAIYYLGGLPFILGLLYFWADMSQSALAADYVAPASLGLAALFVFMKATQAVFTRRLMAWRCGEPNPALTPGSAFRLLGLQTAIQASGLVIIPASALLALPLAWAYAFYQSASLGAGEEGGLRSAIREGRKQAALWPWANHLMLLVLALFALFVFINLALSLYMIPFLLKSLLGIETVFTLSGRFFFNSTFWAVVGGLTYLGLDPLVKAVYTLRCFYGSALASGRDLRVELGAVTRQTPLPAMLIVLGALAVFPATWSWAADRPSDTSARTSSPASSPAEARPGVSAADLGRSINEVINRREFTWRQPRNEDVDQPQNKRQGLIAEFLDWMGQQLEDSVRAIRRWWRNLNRWLDSLFPRTKRGGEEEDGRSEWVSGPPTLMYVVLAFSLSVLGIVIWRTWHQRGKRIAVAAQAQTLARIDLSDESVGADDLPTDGWLALAQDLWTKGEGRLALRALYLATLARLAETRFIALARYKSNRDYERELGRRTTDQPEILAAFGRIVGLFDRVWYGRHPLTEIDFADFSRDQGLIQRDLAEQPVAGRANGPSLGRAGESRA